MTQMITQFSAGLRRVALAVGGLLLVAQPVSAMQIMDFEGLASGEEVLDFYNGGLGGDGSGPGPDFDIGYLVGGSTVFDIGVGNAFSGANIVTTLETNGLLTFSDVGGAPLENRVLSFWYDTSNVGTQVTLYAGADATGAVIGSAVLDATGGGFNWQQFTLVSDPGTVIGSVQFDLVQTGGALFDNVFLDAPVPVPGTLPLMGLAVLLFWRRARSTSPGRVVDDRSA